MNEQPQKADYCLEINFKKGSESPSRVFRSMYELIETFQIVDRSLVKSIDNNIEPVLILEDIESGSIKTWLSNALSAIDDDALKNIDWKPAVGKYIVKAKYFIIDFFNGRTGISNSNDVKPLENELYQLAKETDVKWLPAYEPISRRELLEGIQRISSNISHLTSEDSASYITDEDKVGFNLDFQLVPESLEELLIKETISSDNEMILKVKKPDYLGESMWEFRHGGKIIPAKILNTEWLIQFQSREIDIRPGDSIRAIVKITHKYDYNGELAGTSNEILDIKEVIQVNSPEQISLFKKDTEENS